MCSASASSARGDRKARAKRYKSAARAQRGHSQGVPAPWQGRSISRATSQHNVSAAPGRNMNGSGKSASPKLRLATKTASSALCDLPERPLPSTPRSTNRTPPCNTLPENRSRSRPSLSSQVKSLMSAMRSCANPAPPQECVTACGHTCRHRGNMLRASLAQCARAARRASALPYL